jgi:hypothetical protein
VSTASRTPEQIAAEISATQERLGATIDQLVERVKPKTIAHRQLTSLKARFVGPDGPNVKTIGIVVGGVVGVIALVVTIRKVVG